MPISDSSFAECAASIIDYMNDCSRSGMPVDQSDISRFISQMMARRKDAGSHLAEFNLLKPKEEEFRGMLESLIFPVKVSTHHDGRMFHIEFPDIDPRHHDIVGNHRVVYKEHFTLFSPKDVHGSYEDALSLVLMLPNIASRLHYLSLHYHDNVSMSVQGTVKGLVGHPDTVTVCHKDKSLGRRIRNIIDDEFRTAGIVSSRRVLPGSGFDLIDTHTGSRRNGAELAAEIMSRELMRNPDLAGSVFKLSYWLKSRAKDVRAWDPGSVHGVL